MDNREVRDRIAELMGWKREIAYANPWFSGEVDEAGWRHPAIGFQYSHPIENTLDAAAAAMPGGWGWLRIVVRGIGEFSGRDRLVWTASSKMGVVEVPDTGDEKADRFKLALKAASLRPSYQPTGSPGCA